MAARDLFHKAVKVALQNENWVITYDPLKVEAGGAKFEIDLGADEEAYRQASQEVDPIWDVTIADGLTDETW